MNVLVGLILSGLVVWVCIRFIRRYAPVPFGPATEGDPDADSWSMKRSEPRETAYDRDRLPQSLLQDCPPDPCPDVLYEHLRPSGAITHAELTRKGKAIFSVDCCGSTRTQFRGVSVCPTCDNLDFPED